MDGVGAHWGWGGIGLVIRWGMAGAVRFPGPPETHPPLHSSGGGSSSSSIGSGSIRSSSSVSLASAAATAA